MLTVIFAALTQSRFSTLSFCFSDEAWRPLPGETSINSKKHFFAFYRQNIKKRKPIYYRLLSGAKELSQFS